MIKLHCIELRMSNVTEKTQQTYNFPQKANIAFGYHCKLFFIPPPLSTMNYFQNHLLMHCI